MAVKQGLPELNSRSRDRIVFDVGRIVGEAQIVLLHYDAAPTIIGSVLTGSLSIGGCDLVIGCFL